ncbi:hypothetical protein, variant 2 [Exophiala oligosperma]|nr:hypothetical protein, variant 1 [Exophiala oligosperma]XP_016256899.1 hypothetical protein, variant 2 [Exophiala oligosperma]KIW36682.1 hypothetical protein, variant 1 [Exophiala oligosperma]KIW36683.1 hypothetical protein, variant 2 [Exophiala oligosperma]
MVWKEKVEELESDQKLLSRLMEAIRNGHNGQVENLIGIIRTNTSKEQVSSYIATNFPHAAEEGSPYKAATWQRPPQSPASPLFRATLGTARPLFKVPAKPWTTVTDDDRLVSHLLSLWFTWRHWCYPFIDRDSFVSAMQSGHETDGICTAALVNMILADACFDYDILDDDHVRPSDEKPLQDLFYEEAKRYAETTARKRSLPSIQFMAVQWMFLENRGIDKLAYAIMREMTHHLKQFQNPGRSQEARTPPGKEPISSPQQLLAYTSWAVFVSTTAATFAVRNRPVMEPPINWQARLCQGKPADVWSPYPRVSPLAVTHPSCYLHHLSGLYEICYHISQCVFVDDTAKINPVARDSLEELHRDLTTWYNNLSDCVQVTGVQTPHTLSVHAQYHWAVLVLSELTLTLEAEDDDDATLALLFPVIRAQNMGSALAIADLVHLQSVYWGVDHIPISFLQPVNAALSVVINDLDGDRCKSSFVKLAVALHGLSRRSVSAESMLRVLHLRLRQLHLKSSDNFKNMFKDADIQFEGSVSSPAIGVKPAGKAATAFGAGPMAESYEALVEKWSQFHTRAPSSSGSSSSWQND